MDLRFAVVFACLSVVAAPASLRAADYFVATTGNDNNPGTSAAAPFRNLNRAGSRVNPGDTVTVAAGTYNETVSLVRPGAAGAPIVFRAVNRSAVRINGAVSIRTNYVEFTGFDVTNPNLHGVSLVGHHLTLRNNDIHDCQGNAINAFACDYLTIEGNRLFRNGRENAQQSSGIAIYQPVAFDQAPGYHIVIRRNESFDNESRANVRGNVFTVSNGILLEDFRNGQIPSGSPYRPATLVENNLLYNNVGRAIVVTDSDSITIRHNTAWGNLRVRNTTATAATNGTFTSRDTDGVRWHNNVVVARVDADLTVHEIRTTNGAWDYNIFAVGGISLSDSGRAGFGAQNTFADPLLVDPAAGNFRPARGSLAIDGGGAAWAAATDFSGSARPQGQGVDIGAVEAPAEPVASSGPPVLARLLPSQNALAGNFTTLVAFATGESPLSYQWSKNGSPIVGATGAALNFAPLTAADGGTYAVTVTNRAGSVTSNSAALSIASVPQFEWRAPLPKGGSLLGVAYGAGKFVAVGVNGRVLVSTDGQAWTTISTTPGINLNAVAFDAFQWVAVGAGGAVFTSRDAVTWIQRNAATTANLRAITTVNNAWIACGDTGTIITSLDGVNWSVRNSGVTQTLFAVAGTTGRYVVSGTAGVLLTSTDTAAWTRVTPVGVTNEFYTVGYFNNLFVVAGSGGAIYSSVDGTGWTSRTNPSIGSWIRAVAYGNGRYVFTTDTDSVFMTPDLASYTLVTLPPYSATTPRWAVTYGAGQFIAVGNGGDISGSPDGITWSARGAIGGRWTNYAVTYGDGLWVIAGARGGLSTSPDGAVWTRQVVSTQNWIRGCTYGAGRYVVVGDGGLALRSTDGVIWLGQTNSGTTQSLNAVTFLDGRFVAVGAAGTIVTSTDGAAWTAATSGVTTVLQNVVGFRNRFYAFGNGGVILSSADGIAWARSTSGTTQVLYGAATDGGTLYVVGSGRTILTTTGGQTWVPRTAPALNNANYRSIARSNGGWLIVGDTGVALFSLDGITWNFLPGLGEVENLYSVSSNGESTVVTGEGGTVLQASNPALRAVTGGPKLARDLPARSVVAGGSAAFVADPMGAGPFTFQWYRNGAAIPGATHANLGIPAATAADSGLYSVTVTNAAGSVTSNNGALAVTPLPEFEWRNPSPEGGTLYAIAHANGRYVAVGTGSRVLVSSDGANWNLSATVPTTFLFGLGSDGFQWVAVGNNGALFTSFDLVNWARRNPSTTVNLRSVTHVNGAFLACGDGGTVTVSSDGATWTARPTGVTQILNAIAGTTGRYVAAGQGGVVMTSTDTINWTRVFLTNAAGAAVANDLFAAGYLNGQFVVAGAAGVIFSSPDGTTWTPRTSPANGSTIRGVAYNGSQYAFTTDSDRVVVSPNLTTYTNLTLPGYSLTAPRLAITHGAGQFVAVGYGGEISSSADGTTWSQRGTSGARWVNYGVTYGNDRWLAVGSSGGLFLSPDGMTWARQNSPTTAWLRACAFGAGRFVAAGDSGWIISSVDGVTWTGTQSASATTQGLLGVAFTNGRFVAVGNNGTIVTSPNGTAWTAVPSGVTTTLQGIGTYRDRFFAFGVGGVMLVSDDGISWRPMSSGTTQSLLGSGGDGETLFIVGGGRTILATTDGETWSPRTAPPLNNGNYRGVARANGGWVIVGDAGVALFSLDGASWEFLPTIAHGETLFAMAANSFGAVAVGNGGTILQAVNAPYGISRLTNVATRGFVPPGGSITPGFVLRGTGTKTVVVRAVGPTLATFGLDALSDLRFDLVNQQTSSISAANDDWGGGGALANAFASLGAFPLPEMSKDAAVRSTLPVNQGGYSIRVEASGDATSGVVLAEVYDADDDQSPVRLANVSTLGFVGTGDNVLTPGFVIRGTGAKRLLIRAVGPGLAALGVGGALVDPQLSVYPAGSSTAVANNNDWGGVAALKAAFGAAGAFELSDGSRDAAVLVTLPPGGYTVVISGVGNSTGSALVEVYDLDP